MSADPKTPALAASHWRDLILDGAKVDTPLAAAIVDAGLTRTMEGASTLDVQVHDQFMDLSRTLFRHDARVELDGLEFRLASPDWQGGILDLQFEDEQVAKLREHDSPKSARRDHVTRARFIKSLFDEAGVPFFCPLLDVPQPVEKASQRPSQAAKDTRREPGFSDHAKITVKGHEASASQKRIAERVLDTARRENAGPRATLALLAAVTVECEMKNVQGSGADAVSFGVIQAIPGTSGRLGGGSFTKAQALDVEFSVRSALHYSCTGFENTLQGGGGLIGVARRHPDWSIGRIAAVVINGAVNSGQGAPAYVAAVNSWHDEAARTIDAYGGGRVPSTGSTSDAADKAYVYRRGQDGKREDSWTCARRLADEVNWRLFMIAGRGVYMPDDELLRSRPRMLVTPRTTGIEIQDVRVDSGRRAQELQLTCRAELWAAPPGTVVDVDETGPADGRWLVREIRRASLASPQTEISLSRRQAWKPEPRSESTTTRRAGGETATTGGALANTYLGSPVPGQRAHAATHQTSGLPGYPAYDYMAPAGSPCVAPVTGQVTKLSGHDPAAGPPNGPHGPFGWSVYIDGGGKSYFLTHMGTRTVKVGDRVQQGEKIGTVGDYAKWGGANHIHMGVHG